MGYLSKVWKYWTFINTLKRVYFLCYVFYSITVAFYSEKNYRKRILVVANDSELTELAPVTEKRAGLRPVFFLQNPPELRADCLNGGRWNIPIYWTLKSVFSPPSSPLLRWRRWGQVTGTDRRLQLFSDTVCFMSLFVRVREGWSLLFKVILKYKSSKAGPPSPTVVRREAVMVS